MRRGYGRSSGARRAGLAGLTIMAFALFAEPSTAQQRVAVVNAAPAPRAALAVRLGGRLAAHPEIELIPAESLIEQPGLDASTRTVRRVAFEARLDTLIVSGVVESTRPGATDWIAALRSGHSGGIIASHRVPLGPAGASDAQVDALARELLDELGVASAAAADSGPKPASTRQGTPAASGSSFFGLGGTDADQPIEIESDELEFFSLEAGGRRLEFTRNVRVVQGGTMLSSDHLEALYPDGASQPDRLVATGNVKISQPERRARCERAFYVRAEEKLTCEGRAELVYRCDIVRGNSIQFDLAGDRARVIGAATVVINPAAGQAGSGCAEGDR